MLSTFQDICSRSAFSQILSSVIFILQKLLSLIQMIVESYSTMLMKFTQEENIYASSISENACLI